MTKQTTRLNLSYRYRRLASLFSFLQATHNLHEMTHCVWWRVGCSCILFISFLLTLSLANAPPQALLDLYPLTQHGHGQLGAVASENRVCSQIGIDLLKAGGNAADAVSLCLPFLQAKLTARLADWDHSVHWRAWSATPPNTHDGTTESTQIAIIAA